MAHVTRDEEQMALVLAATDSEARVLRVGGLLPLSRVDRRVDRVEFPAG